MGLSFLAGAENDWAAEGEESSFGVNHPESTYGLERAWAKDQQKRFFTIVSTGSVL